MLWSSFYAPLPRDLIILSEDIANDLDMAGGTRVNPTVSLPLYPSYPAAYPAGRREGGQGSSRGRRGPGHRKVPNHHRRPRTAAAPPSPS